MTTDVQGIVLSGMKYRESGKILRVLTREKGLLSVMAQGVFKKNSRLLSVSEPFAKSWMTLEEGRNFFYIRAAELIELHYGLRSDYAKFSDAVQCVRFLLQILPEGHPVAEIYSLFDDFLLAMSQTKNRDAVCGAFLLKTAGQMGYRPYLYACASCGNRRIRSMRFSQTFGGILCELCTKEDPFGKPFAKSEYMLFYEWQRQALSEIAKEEIFAFTPMARAIAEEYCLHVFGLNEGRNR